MTSGTPTLHHDQKWNIHSSEINCHPSVQEVQLQNEPYEGDKNEANLSIYLLMNLSHSVSLFLPPAFLSHTSLFHSLQGSLNTVSSSNHRFLSKAPQYLTHIYTIVLEEEKKGEEEEEEDNQQQQ